MTCRFASPRALALGFAVATLLAVSPAWSQEGASEPAPAPSADELEIPPAEAPKADEAPPERPESGIWKGRHRMQLVAGLHFGNTVRDAGILAAPVTGQPGSRAYPALSPLQVDFDDAPVFGLRYAYFVGDDWGIEVALEHVSSEIVDPDGNLEQEIELLRTGSLSLTQPEREELARRLTAHQQPHDMSVTFLDVGALHVFNPKKRIPVEIGGGLGWAFASMDGPVAYERLVTSDIIETEPNDPRIVANDVLDPAPAYGKCLADNDPCIELEAEGGLTWHAFLGFGYAFSPNLHFRLGTKVRFIEHLVDPGDSNVMSETTMGLSFQFGGM